jgi:hypothetical protein
MVEVSKIGWTWHTAAAPGSGTDARVTIRVRRDGQQLAYVRGVGRDGAPRPSRYESWWTFVNPTGIGTAVSGKTVPYTEQFPQGVAGHLTVELEIHGDDKWSWEYIGVHVWRARRPLWPPRSTAGSGGERDDLSLPIRPLDEHGLWRGLPPDHAEDLAAALVALSRAVWLSAHPASRARWAQPARHHVRHGA